MADYIDEKEKNKNSRPTSKLELDINIPDRAIRELSIHLDYNSILEQGIKAHAKKIPLANTAKFSIYLQDYCRQNIYGMKISSQRPDSFPTKATWREHVYFTDKDVKCAMRDAIYAGWTYLDIDPENPPIVENTVISRYTKGNYKIVTFGKNAHGAYEGTVKDNNRKTHHMMWDPLGKVVGGHGFTLPLNIRENMSLVFTEEAYGEGDYYAP